MAEVVFPVADKKESTAITCSIRTEPVKTTCSLHSHMSQVRGEARVGQYHQAKSLASDSHKIAKSEAIGWHSRQ